jgi:uncharacterized protein (TIGR04255 family)
MSTPIPSFQDPPVVETVMGVSLAPLSGWGVEHYGLLWEQFRDQFPLVQNHPPLALHKENFETPPTTPDRFQFEIGVPGEVRAWYLTADSSKLIQVQRDLFLFNWRRGESNAEYPRFDSLLPEFQSHCSRFFNFAAANGLGRPDVVTCEVTYVNHIFRGDTWESLEGWNSVFRHFGPPYKTEFLPQMEGLSFNINYRFPGQRGRLRVKANHAIRNSDGREVIVLQLTARGQPATSKIDDIVGWIRMGREWVVRGFTDMTTIAAHKTWKRER